MEKNVGSSFLIKTKVIFLGLQYPGGARIPTRRGRPAADLQQAPGEPVPRVPRCKHVSLYFRKLTNFSAFKKALNRRPDTVENHLT